MRRRRFPVFTSLFIAVALAGLVGAMAFRTSAVSNGIAVTVSTTNSAALAMEAFDPNVATYVNGGVLQLNFSNQQPDSTYTYNGVFKVINQTSQSRTVSVQSVTGEATPGVHLTITTTSPAATLWQNGANGGISIVFTANQVVAVNVQVKVDAGASLTPTNLNITLNGQ